MSLNTNKESENAVFIDDSLSTDSTVQASDPEIKEKTKNFQLDEEQLKLAREILNDDQQATFNEILSFLEDPDRQYFVVEGYAGTGKTFLLSKVISCLYKPVAMSAPTNKAVKVLQDNRKTIGGRSVTYATIHKLLALTVRMQYPPKGSDEDPKFILVKKRNTESTINKYGLLVIDEASMLGDDLLEMIDQEKSPELKIIFMGDPAQIPPVNHLDSKPLIESERKKMKMDHSVLNRIMRQADGNTILLTAYQIRNNRFEKTDTIVSRLSNANVTFYSSLVREDTVLFTNKVLKSFTSEEFANDANSFKLIAWTNKTVNGFNNLIRKSLFKKEIAIAGKLSKIMVGENLIADKPIWEDDTIVFQTSDELKILSYEIGTYHYTLPKAKYVFQQTNFDFMDEQGKGKGGTYDFTYYDCLVQYRDANTEETLKAKIKVLHEKSEQSFIWCMSKVKGLKDWGEYEKLQQLFAEVKYNYAITAHKAQGSTYGEVFLIEDDIDMNPKHVERNRIKYTACTRPKYHLHILSKRNEALKIQEERRAAQKNSEISDEIKLDL